MLELMDVGRHLRNSGPSCARWPRTFSAALLPLPGGARQLALLDNDNQMVLLAGTFGHVFQACLIVGGLGLGLVIGARVTLAFALQRSR